VLVARNIHHSVINALKAFGVDFRFLPTPDEPRFEALMPPSVEQVRLGLARYPEALAVLYTSPTFEGRAAHTAAIADAVHATSEHAMVIVDEAWGGHLDFHPELPRSAMAAGADVCVRSTHKLAGGPAADRADPLARGPRGLRAHGGGLPRVRDDLA
jgi:arginine decarboxylase